MVESIIIFAVVILAATSIIYLYGSVRYRDGATDMADALQPQISQMVQDLKRQNVVIDKLSKCKIDNNQEIAALLGRIGAGMTTIEDERAVALLWSDYQQAISELKKLREVVDVKQRKCTTLGGMLRKE